MACLSLAFGDSIIIALAYTGHWWRGWIGLLGLSWTASDDWASLILYGVMDMSTETLPRSTGCTLPGHSVESVDRHAGVANKTRPGQPRFPARDGLFGLPLRSGQATNSHPPAAGEIRWVGASSSSTTHSTCHVSSRDLPYPAHHPLTTTHHSQKSRQHQPHCCISSPLLSPPQPQQQQPLTG
ncbi:hypothetical protein BT67DRAFT_289670 [Trichocladium antarcticum]|uniref:Uncharacterized protein n=1 Tax=Trichocladium antarcticum TaxID=1450529 RepID=A0AAN6UNL9_9PEZI|nr:hypothetical protein BT67DRAFT_289670 [Trichocladium antarcticum]